MMVGDTQNISHHENGFLRKALWGGFIVVSLGLIILGFFWFSHRNVEPPQAPEAEFVLNAQMEMPFQVLIPAFLPEVFMRQKAQVTVDQAGPQGEPRVLIVYPTRRGDTLTFYEWLPNEQSTEDRTAFCSCMCMSRTECTTVEVGFSVGTLRIMAKVSNPAIVSAEEARTILDTLGPAVNSQVFSSLKQVPVAYSVPPAVDVAVNANGVQELTLVVTPDGYSPEHFAVRKDIPVKLTFRQIGEVGCGNELIIQLGNEKSATLLLATPGDIQTLEFTPEESGEFRFNCPHFIYRGVMTVHD